jgi:hypothetical protein
VTAGFGLAAAVDLGEEFHTLSGGHGVTYATVSPIDHGLSLVTIPEL